MTRLVLISDTHDLQDQVEVPDGDILIHAGDLTMRGALKDLVPINNYFAALPHEHKLVIAGNHDFCFESYNEVARKLLSSVTYLQDESVTVEGIEFYGSPWQPRFEDWAFNADRGPEIAAVWAQIPSATQVLITHGPPVGIRDVLQSGAGVGCLDLLRRVRSVKPKLHVFGHIHEGYGISDIDGIVYANAATCDVDYRICNAPLVIDL